MAHWTIHWKFGIVQLCRAIHNFCISSVGDCPRLCSSDVRGTGGRTVNVRPRGQNVSNFVKWHYYVEICLSGFNCQQNTNVLYHYWIINSVAKIVYDFIASLALSPLTLTLQKKSRFCSGWMIGNLLSCHRCWENWSLYWREGLIVLSPPHFPEPRPFTGPCPCPAQCEWATKEVLPERGSENPGTLKWTQ